MPRRASATETYALMNTLRPLRGLGIFQAPPQPFDEDIVQIPPFAIHADPNLLGLQLRQKIRAGELNTPWSNSWPKPC